MFLVWNQIGPGTRSKQVPPVKHADRTGQLHCRFPITIRGPNAPPGWRRKVMNRIIPKDVSEPTAKDCPVRLSADLNLWRVMFAFVGRLHEKVRHYGSSVVVNEQPSMNDRVAVSIVDIQPPTIRKFTCWRYFRLNMCSEQVTLVVLLNAQGNHVQSLHARSWIAISSHYPQNVIIVPVSFSQIPSVVEAHPQVLREKFIRPALPRYRA